MRAYGVASCQFFRNLPRFIAREKEILVEKKLMTRSRLLTISALALMACVASARPEKNAYLNHRATTVVALVHEAQTDPEVLDRYMRHFAMTRKQVLALLGSLHVERLQKTSHFEMYSVPDGGSLKMHHCTLKKGERLFVDDKGKPVLRLKCGNPLTLGPGSICSTGALLPQFAETSELKPLIPDVDSAVAPMDDWLAMVPPTPEELPALDVEIPAATGPQVAPSIAPPNPITLPPGHSNLIGSLLGIPLLIGGSFAFPHGGNHTDGRNPPPPPVPEPASFLALGAGAAVLIRRRRKLA